MCLFIDTESAISPIDYNSLNTYQKVRLVRIDLIFNNIK